MISALAGRTRSEADDKLSLFAVGDDDQNIYAFNGSSTEFIRRFETDYGARPSYLTDNYRSTGNIIAAANAVIEPARQRMKADHPIAINRARAQNPPGGTGPCLTRWPEVACKSCRLAITQSHRRRRRWPSCSGCRRSIRTGTGREVRGGGARVELSGPGAQPL